jgi:hypothetical protein
VSTQERFGLQLDLTGEEAYQQAASKVQALEAQFNALQSIIARNAPGWEMARKNIDGVASALDRARASAAAAGSAMASASQRFSVGAPGMPSMGGGKAGGGSDRGMNASMGLMAVGAAVDDMQYGFRGILNNIPMIAMAVAALVGAGTAVAMGIGGIAAVIATLGYVSYNAIKPFKEFVDGAAEWVKTAASVGSHLVGMNMDGTSSGYTPESKTYSYEGQKDDIAKAEAKKAENEKNAASIAKWQEGKAWQESLKAAATDAENLTKVQDQLGDQYRKGLLSVQEYIRRMDDVDAAQEKLAQTELRAAEDARRAIEKKHEEEKKANEEARKESLRIIKEAAELEADIEEERWSKVSKARDQAEAAETAREKRRADAALTKEMARTGSRVDFFANAYGGAFGNNAAGAIFRRAAGGQSFDDAQAAIKDQIEARLTAIRDPAVRSQAAAQIAAQARDLAERNAMGGAVAFDLRQQQLNGVGGALGVMMRQQAARFGGMGDVNGPDQKLATAVDKFDAAVSRMEVRVR